MISRQTTPNSCACVYTYIYENIYIHIHHTIPTVGLSKRRRRKEPTIQGANLMKTHIAQSQSPKQRLRIRHHRAHMVEIKHTCMRVCMPRYSIHITCLSISLVWNLHFHTEGWCISNKKPNTQTHTHAATHRHTMCIATRGFYSVYTRLPLCMCINVAHAIRDCVRDTPASHVNTARGATLAAYLYIYIWMDGRSIESPSDDEISN